MDENPGQGTVTCLSCGFRAPASARFCPVCGHALNATQAPSWSPPAAPVPAPAAPTPPPVAPAAPSPDYRQPPAYSQPYGYGQAQGFGPAAGYPAGYGYAPAPAHRSAKPLLMAVGVIGLGVVIVAGALLVSVSVGSHDNSSPSTIALATPTLAPTPAPPTRPPSIAPTSPPSGAFTRTGDPMTDSLGFAGTVTLLADGRVLFAGGWSGGDDSYTPSATAQLYDPKTGTFSLTGAMTVPRARHTATLLTDGRVLITGGVSEQTSSTTGPYLASAELYDPKSGTFAAAGPMVHARANHTASRLADGRVLLVGGNNYPALPATAEIYDPQTAKFTAIGSVLTDFRSGHTATTLADGRILIAGDPHDAAAVLYDPWTNTFSQTGSMSTLRGFQAATLLPDGRVLIAGGQNQTEPNIASAELYDPATGRFSNTGSMGTPRRALVATLLPTAHVLVVGGDASAELYDPTTGVFSPTGSLLNGPISAVRLQDGRVLVIEGGRVAELYQP